MEISFTNERQISIDNLDVTFAPDGLTLSGHLKANPGESQERLRSLAKILLESADKLEKMEEYKNQKSVEDDLGFGKAFD